MNNIGSITYTQLLELVGKLNKAITPSGLNVTINGNLSTEGTLTADSAKIFENITDASGNNRFIEGGVTASLGSDFYQSYGLWSLSGSHLMIVICFANRVQSATLTSGTLATLEFPEWLINKISRIKFDRPVVSIANMVTISSGGSVDTSIGSLTLDKVENNTIQINNNSSVTFGDWNATRVQFDLLVDNE